VDSKSCYYQHETSKTLPTSAPSLWRIYALWLLAYTDGTKQTTETLVKLLKPPNKTNYQSGPTILPLCRSNIALSGQEQHDHWSSEFNYLCLKHLQFWFQWNWGTSFGTTPWDLRIAAAIKMEMWVAINHGWGRWWVDNRQTIVTIWSLMHSHTGLEQVKYAPNPDTWKKWLNTLKIKMKYESMKQFVWNLYIGLLHESNASNNHSTQGVPRFRQHILQSPLSNNLQTRVIDHIHPEAPTLLIQNVAWFNEFINLCLQVTSMAECAVTRQSRNSIYRANPVIYLLKYLIFVTLNI
jgi:hypothetical protein